MNIKDQIRAEIERRYEENRERARYDDYYRGMNDGLDHLEQFLDALPEQHMIKKSNALFDKCVENCDPAVMKEVSENVDKMLGRQPVGGLEEEVKRYYADNFDYISSEQPTLSILTNIARHFAEWGAEHLKR